MPDKFIDTDAVCPNTPDGKHVPDWSTVTVEHDGDEDYIDVSCSKCGRSGCIGSAASLISEISW